jgi:hypothetical protein
LAPPKLKVTGEVVPVVDVGLHTLIPVELKFGAVQLGKPPEVVFTSTSSS